MEWGGGGERDREEKGKKGKGGERKVERREKAAVKERERKEGLMRTYSCSQGILF